MLLFLVPIVTFAQAQTVVISRDRYGVAQVKAATPEDAYFGMGSAVAQDRLWQMEMARRSARGQLSEVLGESAVKSDLQTLKRAYTDDELQAQVDGLPAPLKTAFEAYARGVNATIADRQKSGSLPKGYAQYGFEPRPWSTLDSAAIAVSMARLFGTGGGGELRNLALLQYLQGRPNKSHALDIFDDIGWFNDPASPTTVSAKDDPVKNPPKFTAPTRAQTEAQIKALPNTNLLELAGAMSLANQDETKLLASKIGVTNKMGSYAVVVSPSRSATGHPLLLGAPQMGHSVPTVIHEVALDAPGLKVAGMDVPGIPGVAIGYTPTMAWTLTSGVADIEDVYVAPLSGSDAYKFGPQEIPLDKVKFTLHVKGSADRVVTQERTQHGPVLLKSLGSKSVFSLQSSLWKHEVHALGTILSIPGATTPAELHQVVGQAETSFNVFFAFSSGDIGWRYAGKVPVRASGLDPRLPTPDLPANAWQGVVPPEQMPHVDNPSAGLITNWNNKPVAWWPNFDTPVWGHIFRNQVLNGSLKPGSLTTADVLNAAWTIARKETSSNGWFGPAFIRAADQARGRRPMDPSESAIHGFDGWAMEGSGSAALYTASVRQLRKELFLEAIGTLTGDDLFEQAIQPSLIDRALSGKTKYNYLAGRSADDVLVKAFRKAATDIAAKQGPNPAAWSYQPQRIRVPNQPDIPYGNRGTYLQLTELSSPTVARNMVNPGVSESGDHAFDQVELAREWVLKPMWAW